MASRAATFPRVTAFDRRVFAASASQRGIGGALIVIPAAVATVGLMGTAATLTAAWVIGASFASNPQLQTRTPIALQTTLAGGHYRLLAASSDYFDQTRVLPREAYVAAVRKLDADLSRLAAAEPAAAVPLPPIRMAERAVPLPTPRPHEPPHIAAKLETPPPMRMAERAVPLPAPRPHAAPVVVAKLEAPPPPKPAAPPLARAAPPPPAPKPAALERHTFAALEQNTSPPAAARDSRTAVYDIEAHMVILPSGERLEAHSGLGFRLDDPRYIRDKGRGPTPPNVYNLALREQLFHGVQAIRLKPVDENKMYGRDGILAHTYMLGPSGQSFGCVSFKDYSAFLHAFLRGEVDRIVVVSHLDTHQIPVARRGRDERYAYND